MLQHGVYIISSTSANLPLAFPIRLPILHSHAAGSEVISSHQIDRTKFSFTYRVCIRDLPTPHHGGPSNYRHTAKTPRSAASMAPKFVSLILMLPLLAVISPLACHSLQVSDVIRSTWSQSDAQQTLSVTTNPRGIRATLIHRDRFSSPPVGYRSPTEKLHEDARRSAKRVQFLSRGRVLGRLLLDSPTSSPVGKPVEWETPLSDASDDEYLMEISLGTPPQKFVAVADTGSDLTWLQCLPCKTCARPSQQRHFDPSLSSTYALSSCSSSICKFLNQTPTCTPSSPGCQYIYSYADNSQTSGTLSQDTISIATVGGNVQTEPNFTFGCSSDATTASGLLDNTNGLVGLGQGLASFPSQLGKYFGNKFSYCLVNRSSSVAEESPLIFGDAAVPGATTNGLPLQFTPLVTNPIDFYSTFYYVNLTGITVNKVALSIPAEALEINQKNGSGGTIFDSGTTYTSLVDEAFNPLITAINNLVVDYNRVRGSSSNIFELCYEAKWDKWASEYGNQVPALSFKFANATSFDLGVDAAWVQYSDSVICLAIMRGPGSNVFGNVQQMDYLILYDLENQQIGFGKADCKGTPISADDTSQSPTFHRSTLASYVGMSILPIVLSAIFFLAF